MVTYEDLIIAKWRHAEFCGGGGSRRACEWDVSRPDQAPAWSPPMSRVTLEIQSQPFSLSILIPAARSCVRLLHSASTSL